MIDSIQIRLKHFAKNKELKLESSPCIQHTIMYTAENPLLSKHAKLEYKNYIRHYLEDLFNDRFFLYEVEVEGKQTVVVSVVELKDKLDIETGKEVITK